MSYAVGIDLGTTFTAAAVSDGSDPRMVSLAHDRVSIPSVIAPSGDRLLVGEEALSVSTTAPWNVAREFKRRFGDPTPMVVDGVPYLPEMLTGRLLEWVVGRVSEMEGSAPDEVVVTHPATWGDYKLDLLRSAAAGVGLEPTLVPEPSAAAIHYHRRSRVPDGEAIAVYDLGGGTFDVTILERDGEHYRLRGTAGGLERAGGLDLDDTVFRHVIAAVREEFESLDQDDPEAMRAVARLKEECVRAKIGLSYDTRVIVPVVLPAVVTEVIVQRSEFERSISELIAETIAATQQVVAGAELTPDELHAVLLVGGSSRVPVISQRLAESLGVDVVIDTHPKHAVAMGAVSSLFGQEADVRNEDARPSIRIAEPQEVPQTTVTVDFDSVAAELSKRFLIVLTGPSGGSLIELPEGSTILGRQSRDDVVGLGSPLVSRRHVTITRSGAVVRVADLGSTNGTRVDGVVLETAEVEVEPGTVLDVANTLIMVDGPGARVESVQALADSWVMPDGPSAGGLADRVLRRRTDNGWLADVLARADALSTLSARVRRARRFERPTAALLQAWESRLPERLEGDLGRAASVGTVVVGYAHLESPLDLALPAGSSKRDRLEADEILRAASIDAFVPLTIPVLDTVTILDQRGPEAEAILRSISHEFRHRHPLVPVLEVTGGVTGPDGSLLIIRAGGLDSERRAEVRQAIARSRGAIWIGPDPGGWADPVAEISFDSDAAIYRPPGDPVRSVSFLPATLAS